MPPSLRSALSNLKNLFDSAIGQVSGQGMIFASGGAEEESNVILKNFQETFAFHMKYGYLVGWVSDGDFSGAEVSDKRGVVGEDTQIP